MEFLCSHPDIDTKVDHTRCPDCTYYKNGDCPFLKSYLAEVRAKSAHKRNTNEPSKLSRPVLPPLTVAQKAQLANEALMWAHRLKEQSNEKGITLTHEQALEIAGLLERIPHLLESEAMAEIGLKQAKRVDRAHSVFRSKGNAQGLRAAARELGWTTGKRQSALSEELLLYEYIRLLEKHGHSTEGKIKAIDRLREKYNFTSREAVVKRLERARTRLRKKAKDTGQDTSDFDNILPSSFSLIESD